MEAYKKINTMKILIYLIGSIVILVFPLCTISQTIIEQDKSTLFGFDKSGKLTYSIDTSGNRLPDFSHVGYHSGEKAIPIVQAKITLEPGSGDDTRRIQEALDKLGTLPPDKFYHRGALVLKRGVYRVEGTLSINYSGVILRGEGNGPEGTIIVATGYNDFKYKRTLITVGPKYDTLEAHTSHRYASANGQIKLIVDSKQEITDDYVPVGSSSFHIKSASNYKTGDKIVVYRPSTADWIRLIGCDQLESRWAGIRDIRWVKDGPAPGFYYQRLGYDSQYRILQKENENWDDFVKRIPLSEDGKTFDFTKQWEPGEYDFYFERRITGIKGNQVFIDAPIVHSMDKKYGGGAIYHYKTPERITEIGIENLRMVSEFAIPVPGYPYGDPEKMDEAETHAWNGIHLKSNTENTWVKDVTGNFFGWSLISVSGKRATVQDCLSLGHASQITGGRRYPFMVDGQLNLVQRCITFEGRHEFVNQQKTAGPNVFVDCIGFNSKQHAGPHHRYAVGNLYDNVKSELPLESRFRGNSGTGHGWAGTQTCFYNCIAPGFLVENPPGGICWVLGSGKIGEKNIRLDPASLYYQQVKERLGNDALKYLLVPGQLEHLGEYRWVEKRLRNEKNINLKKL
jgi:hypothetical protein